MTAEEQHSSFIRVEGFVDAEQLTRIQELVGHIGLSRSFSFEELPLRDRDSYGPLLADVPDVGVAVTEYVLTQFSRRYGGVDSSAYSRASTAFDAIYRHVNRQHNNPTNGRECSCCLQGGIVNLGRGRHSNYQRYIEPVSLVTANRLGQLDDIPVSNAPKSKGLKDAACFNLLQSYVFALTN